MHIVKIDTIRGRHVYNTVRIYEANSVVPIAVRFSELDISDKDEVTRYVREHLPHWIIDDDTVYELADTQFDTLPSPGRGRVG